MTERNMPRRQYTDDYKLESARLAQSLGTNEAARRSGLPPGTLGRWRRQLDAEAIVGAFTPSMRITDGVGCARCCTKLKKPIK